MASASLFKNGWLNSVLACPFCLTPDIAGRESLAEEKLIYLQCAHCNRIFPIDQYGVTNFQVVDKILSLPEPYFGMWALAQHGSLVDYKNRSPGSIAHPDREIVKAFSNFIDLNGRIVLDIGSGTDYTPGYIEKQAVKEYVALDPLPVEQNVPYAKVQAWAEFMPFIAKSFDVAILATSLDHILCLESFLAEIMRVINDNGYIYIWGAWFTDETWFKNIPPRRLFLRVHNDILPESESMEIFKKSDQLLKMKYQDIQGLQQRYSQYLVDKWHFRHIPIHFIRKMEKYGLEPEAIELWEVNYHYETTFLNGFLKFRKKASGKTRRNENLAQHLDILTLLTKLFEKVYFCDERTRQVQSEQNEIRKGTEAINSLVNTLVQGLNLLDERIKRLEGDLRKITREADAAIPMTNPAIQYPNAIDLIRRIRGRFSRVKEKIRNFISKIFY
jgi:SAM-dependent methyltransferase